MNFDNSTITTKDIPWILDYAGRTQLRSARGELDNGGIIPYVGSVSGVGKSRGVQAYADRPSKVSKSGKYALLNKYMIAGQLPEDVGVCYIPNTDTKEMDSYVIGDLTGNSVEDADDYEKIIIFIDEVNSGSRECLASLQDGIEGRCFNGVPVRENVIYVLAGNPEGTGCGTEDLPANLKSRLAMYELVPDQNEFVEYLTSTGQNHNVVAYLGWKIYGRDAQASQRRGDSPIFCEFDEDAKKNPDPRGWSKFAAFLDENPEPRQEQLTGHAQLGGKTYEDFAKFKALFDRGDVVKVKDIIADPEEVAIPSQDFDTLYAVITNCVNYINEEGEDLEVSDTDAITIYLDRVADVSEAIANYAFQQCKQRNPLFTKSEEHSKYNKKHSSY